jgi:hypothetical protein
LQIKKLPKGAWHLWLTFLIFVKNKNMIYLEKCFKWGDNGNKYINWEVFTAEDIRSLYYKGSNELCGSGGCCPDHYANYADPL